MLVFSSAMAKSIARLSAAAKGFEMTTNAHEAGKVSDERLVEMLTGLKGVTEGPWDVMSQNLRASDQTGHWRVPLQVGRHPKGGNTFAEVYMGGPAATHNNRVEVSALADHIARCDPDTIRSIITELRTRRAESQTGAVRVSSERMNIDEIVERAAWKLCALENEVWDETDENFKARYRLEAAQMLAPNQIGKTLALALSALEPTPIKETAEPEHIATDVHSETANAEHVPAIPADVQGVTDEMVLAGLANYSEGGCMGLSEQERREVVAAILHAAFALSDYQRLAAENERLRAMLFPYADEAEISGMSWGGFYLIGNSKSISELGRIENRAAQLEQFRQVYDESVARERTLRKAAEGRLAEAGNLMREIDAHFWGDVSSWEISTDEDIRIVEATRTFLASLTSPPTEQGET